MEVVPEGALTVIVSGVRDLVSAQSLAAVGVGLEYAVREEAARFFFTPVIFLSLARFQKCLTCLLFVSRSVGPSNPARSDLRIEGFAAEQREEGKKAPSVRVMLLTLHRLMLLA